MGDDLVAQAEAREAEAYEFFTSHDLDRNGSIDRDELVAVLNDLGLRGEGDDDSAMRTLVDKCMQEHDVNSDGKLSFSEFKLMYNAAKGVKPEDMRVAVTGGADYNLPRDTFTAGPPKRDKRTGGIMTDIRTDFCLGKTLGTGGFAVVKSAIHYRTKQTYAVKIMNIAQEGMDVEDMMTLEEISEEIRLTMSLSTTMNIVKVYDYYITKAHVYVVMECLKGGELLDYVLDHGELSENDAAVIIFELLAGLKEIHARAISHRDLKLENLIFAEPNDLSSLRIADFGLAKKMKTARGKLTMQCGTPAYVAPEIITGKQYGPAVDMWATGVILYAMLTGELPFEHDKQQESFKLIAKGKYAPLPPQISQGAADLIDKLLCVKPATRYTAAEALTHPWIRKHTSKIATGPSARSVASKSRVTRAAESTLGTDLRTRTFKAGDLLIKKGDRAKEVFLIREGRCVVVVQGSDGKEVQVAERGPGEFVGEMGVKMTAPSEVADADGTGSPTTILTTPLKNPRKSGDALTNMMTLMRVKNHWVGGRRGADVRAASDMTVVVLNGAQMRWILDHDYGADDEVQHEIQDRKLQMSKSLSRA